MTTATLDLAYLVSVFQAVQQGTENGTYAIVPADAAEVAALVKAKYIKTNKRLHNADGNVGAVLVEGANLDDLKLDFEIPDFAATSAPEAPVPEEATPLAEQVAEAPQAAIEPTPAPFSEHNPAAAEQETFAPVIEQTDMTQIKAEPAAAFEPALAQVGVTSVDESTTATATVSEALAPVVEENGVLIIGADAHEVVAQVETRAGAVDIDVGVPFVKKLSKKEAKPKAVEHYPFNAIADVKKANPTTVPSFHVAGKALKDMSNSVKRACKRAADDGLDIVYRAVSVDENDPKGAGVRVYAFFTHEDPAPPRVKAKVEAAEPTETAGE